MRALPEQEGDNYLAWAGRSRAKGSASLRVVYRFWKVCKNCNCAPQGQVILLPPVRGQTPWPPPNTRSFTVGGKFAGMCRHPPSWVEAYRPLNRDFWVNRASRCFTVKLRLSAGAALKSCPGARDQARARLPNKAAAPWVVSWHILSGRTPRGPVASRSRRNRLMNPRRRTECVSPHPAEGCGGP